LNFGDGYAEIVLGRYGQPIELWPIESHRVAVSIENGSPMYRVSNPGREDLFLDSRRMLHLHGPSLDGFVGVNIARIAREALSLAAAAERFSGTFFGNGATFGGILSSDKPLGDKTAENLRKAINARHQGVSNAHRFLLLDGGSMKYDKLGTDPEHAQLLEMRTFQIREIARFLRIPVSKLGDLERSTYSNIEQQNLDYYQSCLRPWFVRFEQELDLKLLTAADRATLHFEHVLDGLLRADTEKRAQFYQVMSSAGLMTPNEIRRLENLPPFEGGDQVYKPLNTAPINEQVVPNNTEGTAA
jgi:HK97 family phage portal protein